MIGWDGHARQNCRILETIRDAGSLRVSIKLAISDKWIIEFLRVAKAASNLQVWNVRTTKRGLWIARRAATFSAALLLVATVMRMGQDRGLEFICF